MDTKEILKKVRKIEIKTKRLSNHIFSGEYHSSFKGRGMTFSEVREYQMGDDVRNIDWNVTARYDKPFIKIFEEERELTMVLMVDISGSQFFGTKSNLKKEMVAEIAATLAFSAIQNNDKVGLVLFSKEIELYIPPKKGKGHVLRIIRELIEFHPQKKETSLKNALEFLSKVIRKKAIVFLISDFLDENYAQNLEIVAKRHDVTGIRIYDFFEKKIPNLGFLLLKDNETGKMLRINTASKKIRKNYEEYYTKSANDCQDSFKNSGSEVIHIATDESYIKKLITYFKQR